MHGRVDGGALQPGQLGTLGRLDAAQLQTPAKNGFHITLLPGQRAGGLHVVFNAGVAVKVTGDVVLGRGVIDTQIACQAKGAHAIDETKVDDLGIAALFAGNLVHRYVKHLGCSGAVHIQPVVERLEQGCVIADMGHDAQLDLRIVGAGNNTARRCHKSLAHTPALGRANRYVLKIGVVTGQPPGDCYRLCVVRMHPAGARQRELGQLVGIGALELGQTTVLQQLGRQGVVFCQFFQHFFIGAACAGSSLLHHRHAQLVKENFAQLFGATQVKGLARNFISLGLQLQDALTQLMALLGQCRCVNQHPIALDAVQRFAAGNLQGINKSQLFIRL